ncbi:RNA polymerase sigma-70 factor (ECF subfamily) [Prauserella shujinwangii]|uniref:RNA polymerase sigma-70 factor (ECF subfamily) n=1 Tax=Prauserella shujinwangii TaxID=1453103 RepID=A0A2T0M1J0_9PSEU|nr:sigma-70 family RNA polymerase sigma factor [Prauserella shujinwangii]PRX50472.1 RNA polymerase sigma-70 factor (ECF subfamily) [Prauserella shujinwangii]
MTTVPTTGQPALERPDLGGADAAELLAGLYDAHARGLHRYLSRRLAPATADDLVAETFLAAWAGRADYDPARGTARAWLYGIATNLLRRHARQEVRGLRALARANGRAAITEPLDTAAASRVDAEEVLGTVAGTLAGLRREERDVLLLVAWAELTPAEAADALGIPPRTARTRLHRARTRLRNRLMTEEADRD